MYKVILLGDNGYEQSHVVTQITKVHNQIPATVSKETYYYSINTVSKETTVSIQYQKRPTTTVSKET